MNPAKPMNAPVLPAPPATVTPPDPPREAIGPRRAPRRRWFRRIGVTLVLAALVVALGNGLIVGTHALLHARAGAPAAFPGVPKFAAVDERLWRGAAPDGLGYRTLAERGVRTIVDLRAEEHLEDISPWLTSLGVTLVRIPIRDGQAPTQAQVDRFRDAVRSSPGTVFVHCGAGIGRTGVMAATYLVEERGESPRLALRENLELGPPSLEQLDYVSDLEGTPAGSGRATSAEVERPGAVVVGASRVLDAPRRLWSRYGP